MKVAATTLRGLYNAVLKPGMSAAFFVGSLLNKRFALRAAGVKQSRIQLNNLPARSAKKRYWFHAASMGEFEQAKPVIEHIKRRDPDCEILASFFSVSGYANQQDYPAADWKVYIPIDTRAEAKRFVDQVLPDAAIFVRYDIWFNHLNELQQRKIPAYLICATVNLHSWRYHAPFLAFTQAAYACFTTVFALDDTEAARFESLELGQKVITSGDTRMDRIVEAVKQSRLEPALALQHLDATRKYLVLGSSWPAEEHLLADALKLMKPEIRTQLGLIIVPHEPTPEHVKTLQEEYPRARLYSQISTGTSDTVTSASDVPVIIVDSIGLLLRIYAQASLAFVGGGFGAGVHSVTEPAGHGLPICCGPHTERARAAQELETHGGLTVVDSAAELAAWLTEMLSDSAVRAQRGRIAEDYVAAGVGFSERIGDVVMGG